MVLVRKVGIQGMHKLADLWEAEPYIIRSMFFISMSLMYIFCVYSFVMRGVVSFQVWHSAEEKESLLLSRLLDSYLLLHVNTCLSLYSG